MWRFIYTRWAISAYVEDCRIITAYIFNLLPGYIEGRLQVKALNICNEIAIDLRGNLYQSYIILNGLPVYDYIRPNISQRYPLTVSPKSVRIFFRVIIGIVLVNKSISMKDTLTCKEHFFQKNFILM